MNHSKRSLIRIGKTFGVQQAIPRIQIMKKILKIRGRYER